MFTKEKTNICKGVAILMLLFHHMFLLENNLIANHMHFYIFPERYIPKIAVIFRVCVWIFVFLSAYGLTYKFKHSSENRKYGFLSKQWVSLMKPFWFVFVLASFAFCLKGENIIDKHQSSLLLYLIDGLGWADFIHGPMISGVFWYMCLAQLILLFIPLTYKLLNTLSNYGFISLCFITTIHNLRVRARSTKKK